METFVSTCGINMFCAPGIPLVLLVFRRHYLEEWKQLNEINRGVSKKDPP
jgi:hypothetical protein